MFELVFDNSPKIGGSSISPYCQAQLQVSRVLPSELSVFVSVTSYIAELLAFFESPLIEHFHKFIYSRFVGFFSSFLEILHSLRETTFCSPVYFTPMLQ